MTDQSPGVRTQSPLSLDEAPDSEAHAGAVLIVDDDPVMRQLIRSLLESIGCAVACAMNGADAFHQAIARPPDLILLDMMLPDIDGLDVCRQIRSQPALAEVPVIMITSLSDTDVRWHSLEAGADDFIAKPIDFLELRARVGSILRLNRYRRLVQERANRQRAEEEIVCRNRELSLLNEFIASTATRLHSLDWCIETPLHDACRVLTEALGLSPVFAWMPGYGRAALTGASYPDSSAIAPPDDVVRGLITAQGHTTQTVVVVAEEVQSPAIRNWLHSHHAETILLVPIPMSGIVAGTLAAFSTTRRSFDSREQAFGQSLGSALGQAIESALLHRQLQRHVDSLEEIVAHRTHELQVERDRTQAILEALGEAVIVTDAEGVISYVNPAMTELSGYASEELLGRNWCNLQQGESAVTLCHHIRQYVATGRTWRGEFESRQRNDATYDVAMTVAPIFTPQQPGKLAGMVSIQRDITPIKDAERAKDRFISNVSHELRTPLAVITLHSGNLETLYDRLGDNQRRRLIREIRNQADVLNDLIGDVLELSRIDSGRLRMDERPIDLGALLVVEGNQLRALAERKGLQFEVQSGERLIVQGDESLLRQAIRNLISNAVKFTPPGGRVRAECALMETHAPPTDEWPGYTDVESGEWIGLRVIDNGIGIAPEDLSHLFDRFYRVQNQMGVPGTGLGLAITRELVTRHGGWTGVASLPGKGSTFAFYLPYAAE